MSVAPGPRPRAIASWSNARPSRTTLEAFSPDRWSGAARDGLAVIPRGSGRSFSDAAYIGDGRTLHSLDHNAEPRLDGDVVRCASGTTVGDLQAWLAERHRRLAVYGGTQWATVGGAVASDIHGKNHPEVGSFGGYVREVELLTADGERIRCSRATEPDVFAATIGGMGLTGFITELALELDPDPPGALETRWETIDGLGRILERFAVTDDFYRVCTIVDLSRDDVRGMFCTANPSAAPTKRVPGPLRVPVPRAKLIRPRAVRVLEGFFNGSGRPRDGVFHERDVHYAAERYFPKWNRFFGSRGFLEFQFTLPPAPSADALTVIRSRARRQGVMMCFAVIKVFGSQPPAGLLSFPREGLTVNFQVENSPTSRKFLSELTDEVVGRGSRLYLAKDAIARPDQFARACPELPRWQTIVRRLDPEAQIQSELSRRLALKDWGAV